MPFSLEHSHAKSLKYTDFTMNVYESMGMHRRGGTVSSVLIRLGSLL